MGASARLSVERVDAGFVARARSGSPDARAFNDPEILGRLCDEVEWWAACIGADPVVLWPACRPYGREIRPPFLSYFVGPLRSAHCWSLAMHRRVPLVSAALQCLATVLCREYGSVRASFPPGFDDLRGLRWWQEANPTRRTVLTPRWTAQLVLPSEGSMPSLRANMARNRRRDIAAVDLAPPAPAGDLAVEEVEALYLATFGRQGRVPEPERGLSLRRTVDVLKSGHGALSGWRDPEDGLLVATLLVVDGPQEANDVLCAAAPAWRDRGLIAWATWQGMQAAARRGRNCFDFNGANSEVRAPDKHHYGAAPVLYFDVELSHA